MSERVSLQDIADSLGISRGTVDRAIHGRGRISGETRDRVLTEARRLGYIDRKIESFLPLQQKGKIIAVIPDGDPFFEKIEDGIKKALNETSPPLNLKTIHMRLDNPAAQIDFLQAVSKKPCEVDGLIIVPADQKLLDTSIAAAEKAGIRLATLNTDAPASGRSFFVGQDVYASGRTAGELMLRMNRGPVKVLCGFESIWAHAERVRGFLDVYREAGREDSVKGLHYTRDENSETAFLLDSGKAELGGIYAVSGISTEEAGRYIEMSGSTGITLVGFDCTSANIELLKAGHITTLISQSPELQGYYAVRHLLRLMKEDSAYPADDIRIPIDIYFRENINYFINRIEL